MVTSHNWLLHSFCILALLSHLLFVFSPLFKLSEDWQGNILHVFAHMLDLAKSKAAFKKSIGEYKMGKVKKSAVLSS